MAQGQEDDRINQENERKRELERSEAAKIAYKCGLGINAGHDLSLDNIKYFKDNVPHLLEVSIGHALICESLYLGLDNVVNMYLNKLK